MATDVKHAAKEASGTTEDRVVQSAQQFWSKNSKFILYGLTAVILVVGGYFGYKNFVKGPEDVKAANAMWKAQEHFKADSFNLALNGEGTNLGFLKVISRYSGTKSANLAKFYAGACYLQLGDFNNAIKYLKDFSTDDKLVQLRATGLLGDANGELGKKAEAADYYKKAGTLFPEDDVNSPEYLFRAALLLQDLNKTKEAIELLKTIRDKYPQSQRGYEVDKYLAKLGETR